ncbi:MAG: SDR family oxidoreductase [Acidimicrobiales bacterium]|nr:SDR family oxidoreductase [Acidimicrobiales bacterium]
MRFEGRVAVVTGGSRGIGRAYAERFLREGASVVVADVDEANGAACVTDLSALGPISFVRCDVADASSAEACAAATVDAYGRLDVLINNAALYGDWNLADQSEEYLRRVFDVNLHGVWLMTRAVAPQMVAQGYGRIINQASAAAYNYNPTGQAEGFDGLNAYNYQQTKWGVVGLTKFSAAQLGVHGITVNCIAPGVIDTEATRNVVPAEAIEFLATKQAVPGVLHADDLTGAVAYFASEEARFVTGQTLVIDGGKYMPA